MEGRNKRMCSDETEKGLDLTIRKLSLCEEAWHLPPHAPWESLLRQAYHQISENESRHQKEKSMARTCTRPQPGIGHART